MNLSQKIAKIPFCILFLIILFLTSSPFVFAESKYLTSGIFPKLSAEETKDPPELITQSMYPSWGVPCTNFTYSVIYKDSKARPPAYAKIWLNGEWHDLSKSSGDFKTGARYTYNIIPASGKSLFYFFEASNGIGKARANIIDSPDQGPALYSEKFDNNQIILLDKSGKLIWAFDTGRDMVEGVAVSKNGNYVAAVTNYFIYLFSAKSNVPVWKFCRICEVPGYVPGNFAGISLSEDGSYVAASLQSTLYLFSRKSSTPLWAKDVESGAIGVSMSDDASLIAVGTANSGTKGDKLFLFNKDGKNLFEYRAEHPGYTQTGNFYRPAVTPDGKYIASSTGCPDRRAYLFSQNSLLFRSTQLTYDSPIHKSAISDDGSIIAYSADNMQGKEIVFVFNPEGKILWNFSSSEDSTARAVSVSGDGSYVAAGTSAGHIYLFSKENSSPLWKFTIGERFAQVGDVKLSKDGSLLAAASQNKKIYLFSSSSNVPLWVYDAPTWVTKLDFNGDYIVAGTGLREYIGEGSMMSEDNVVCTKIIQPAPMQDLFDSVDSGGPVGVRSGSAECGNELCEPDFGETPKTCASDCDDGGENDLRIRNGKYVEKPTRIGSAVVCGDNICEGDEVENCYKDCGMKPDKTGKSFEQIESSPSEKEAQNAFAKIIEFFKRLFSKNN